MDLDKHVPRRFLIPFTTLIWLWLHEASCYNLPLSTSKSGRQTCFRTDAIPSSEGNGSPGCLARRGFCQEAGKSIFGSVMMGNILTRVPSEAQAVYLGSPVMVQKWPEIRFLVPLYEMDKSLRYLESQMTSNTTKGLLKSQDIVENFSGGGLASNKNLFKLFCAGYIGGIVFDDPDIELVRQEQRDLLDAGNAVVYNIEAMREPLKQLVEEGAKYPSEEVLENVKESREAMDKFLSRVPSNDFTAIDSWIEALKDVDKNRNGSMEPEELESLSEEYQELYKEVGDFLGG
jgi:hypothetical protein